MNRNIASTHLFSLLTRRRWEFPAISWNNESLPADARIKFVIQWFSVMTSFAKRFVGVFFKENCAKNSSASEQTGTPLAGRH